MATDDEQADMYLYAVETSAGTDIRSMKYPISVLRGLKQSII